MKSEPSEIEKLLPRKKTILYIDQEWIETLS